MARNKEQIITDMLDNGLLSDEDAKRYLSDKSVSADEMKYIGQLILLCKKNQEEVKAGRVYSVEDLINNLKRRYMTDSVRVGDDYSKEEQEAIEAIIRRGDEDMKNGRYMSEEEFIKRAGISLDDEELKEEYEAIRRCEDDIKNGRIHPFEETVKRFKGEYTPKAQTLKSLLDRGDISQDEYNKYMNDKNFTDYSAEELKDDYDAIRRCEDDIKNGRIYTEEEAIKRREDA